jgi:hypothetical protein
MTSEIFVTADEVARELRVSKPYAYKLIREMNAELKKQGFLTISGKVSRQYFSERIYGGIQINEKAVS